MRKAASDCSNSIANLSVTMQNSWAARTASSAIFVPDTALSVDMGAAPTRYEQIVRGSGDFDGGRCMVI